MEQYDLTGDDDLMDGPPAGPSGPAQEVAPTVPEALDLGLDELVASCLQGAGSEAPPWVQSLFTNIELMHKKQFFVGLRRDVECAGPPGWFGSDEKFITTRPAFLSSLVRNLSNARRHLASKTPDTVS